MFKLYNDDYTLHLQNWKIIKAMQTCLPGCKNMISFTKKSKPTIINIKFNRRSEEDQTLIGYL